MTTAGGTGTLAGGFTYVAAPTVTTVSPSTGPTTGGTAVTITGTAFVVGGTTVTVGGVAVTGVTVQSATQLTGTTPAGTAGAKLVVVTTAGGTATLAVSDLPGFTAPAELRYTSWSFRATFASLNAQVPAFFPKPFPLVPTVSGGDAVSLGGTLRAGSGVYHRVVQLAGAQAFTLRFTDGSAGALTSSATPRLNVIRIE